MFTASMCHLKANELHKLAYQDSSGAIHYRDDLLKLGGHDGNRTQKNSYLLPSCERTRTRTRKLYLTRIVSELKLELELENFILQGL